MPDVHTSLVIAAPPERVWAVFTDFAAWPQWNSVFSRLRVEPRVGSTIRFRIKIEATPTLAFAARVVRCDEGRAFAWRGGAPLMPSLAWGEHWFEMEPTEGGTRFSHGERFGGLLALVMRGAVHARVTRTYDGFNRALKARVEV